MPEERTYTLDDFANVLADAETGLGAKVTSAYRPGAKVRGRGVPSQHGMPGHAADMQYPGGKQGDQEAIAEYLRGRGFHAFVESPKSPVAGAGNVGWIVHVENRPSRGKPPALPGAKKAAPAPVVPVRNVRAALVAGAPIGGEGVALSAPSSPSKVELGGMGRATYIPPAVTIGKQEAAEEQYRALPPEEQRRRVTQTEGTLAKAQPLPEGKRIGWVPLEQLNLPAAALDVAKRNGEVRKLLFGLQQAAARYGLKSPEFAARRAFVLGYPAVKEEITRRVAPEVAKGVAETAVLGGWGPAAKIGGKALAPVVGKVGGRILSEAGLGYLAAAGGAASEGKAPGEVLKQGAMGAGITGGIVGAGPILRRGGAGLRILGEAAGEARLPAMGGEDGVSLRNLVEALSQRPGIVRAGALAQKGLEKAAPVLAPVKEGLARVVGVETAAGRIAAKTKGQVRGVQEAVQRSEVEEDFWQAALSRRDVQASRDLKEAARIQAKAWADEATAQGRVVGRGDLKRMRQQFLGDFDTFVQQSFDTPAARMNAAYEQGRTAAAGRFSEVGARLRAIETERRQLAFKMAAAGARAGTQSSLYRKLKARADALGEEWRGLSGDLEETARAYDYGEEFRRSQTPLLRLLTRWGRGGTAVKAGWGARPVILTEAGKEVVGRPVAIYDLAQAEEEARALGISPEELRTKIGELVRRSRSRVLRFDMAGASRGGNLLEGGGPVAAGRRRLKDWGEVEQGLTATEAAAAAKVLREDMQGAGRTLAEESRARGAVQRKGWEFGRTLTETEALRGRAYDQTQRLGGLREQRQGLMEEAAGLRQEREGLGWSQKANLPKGQYPAEIRAAAEAEKAAAQTELWGQADKSWHPRAVGLLKGVAKSVREVEDVMGRNLAEVGILSKEAAARWQGVHLRVLLPQYRGKDLEELVGWLETHSPGDIPQEFKRAAMRGAGGAYPKSPVTIPGAIFEPRQPVPEWLTKRPGPRPVSLLERARVGESLAAQSVARARALRTIGAEHSISAEAWGSLPVSQKVGYVPIPEGKVYGALSGRYMEKPIFRVMQAVVAPEEARNVGRKLVNWFKITHVPMSLAVSIHNVLSNKMMGMIEYGIGPFLPKNYLAAADELLHNRGLWAQVSGEYPLGSGLWTRAEIRQVMKAVGPSKTMPDLMRKLNNIAVQKPSAAYGAMELLDKWAASRWDILTRGEGPAAAMRRADDALINYGRVPWWLRTVRSSPVGALFLTFPYKIAVELGPHWLKQHPGKLYAMYKAPGIISKGMASASNERDQMELEKAVMPSFYASDFMLRLPWKDSDGSALWLDLSRINPFADVAQNSFVALRDAGIDISQGGVGEGALSAAEGAEGLMSPVYSLLPDAAQALRGYRRAGPGFRYTPLEDMSAVGRLKLIAGQFAGLAAPGVAYDLAKIATASGPSAEHPGRRTKFLEAVRAAGLPIVRIKPDVMYRQAFERWDRIRNTAARKELGAESGSLQESYWRRVGVTAERHLDELMRVGPPELTEPLLPEKMRGNLTGPVGKRGAEIERMKKSNPRPSVIQELLSGLGNAP